MSWRRKSLFGAIAVGMILLGAMGLLLAADAYVHRKFQDSGGVNVWGYRGPVVGRKQPGERRVAMIGGSTTLGYGARADESVPAFLERLLAAPDASGARAARTSVVNLGFNNDGAESYRFTLADYAYLDSDLLVFYTGYNDLATSPTFDLGNRSVNRHGSLIFRWTGYYPMLATVMREKALAIRYGGRLDDAYANRPTVFRPTFAQRTAAGALETATKLGDQLDRLLVDSSRAPHAAEGRRLDDADAVECGAYAGYCNAMFLTLSWVIEHGKRALVVSQPLISQTHREQQEALDEYLPRRFPDRARVQFVDLSAAVDVRDAALSGDGMHLTAAGNRQVAQALVTPVRSMLADPPVQITAPPPRAPESTSVATQPIRLGPAGPAPGTRRPASEDGREMAWVPPGTFTMGSDARADETPHRVTIANGFWMDTTEVTNDAYRRFVLARSEWSLARLPSAQYAGAYMSGWTYDAPPAGRGTHPMTHVIWTAARAYCEWAGKRLPTEAEWEYAARAGTSSAYWWGDVFDPSRANRNEQGTESVGQAVRRNPWGLADMAGNVWEWTSSLYRPYPYRDDDGRESADPSAGRRVLRGGSWMIGAERLRSADRFKFRPTIASPVAGFRCVKNDPSVR